MAFFFFFKVEAAWHCSRVLWCKSSGGISMMIELISGKQQRKTVFVLFEWWKGFSWLLGHGRKGGFCTSACLLLYLCACVCVFGNRSFLWTLYSCFGVERAFVARTHEAQVLSSWVIKRKGGLNAKCVMDTDATELKRLLGRNPFARMCDGGRVIAKVSCRNLVVYQLWPHC